MFRHSSPTQNGPRICLLLCLLVAQALAAQNTSNVFDDLAKSATAAREAGRSDEAAKQYRQAIEIRPEWEEGWWYLGVIEYDADHYSDAAAAFRRVLRLDPNQGAAMNFLGLCEFETADYPAALDHLQRAQAFASGDDPDLARTAQYHLALLLNRSGDFAQSQQTIKLAFPGQLPPQAKIALGISLLRIPLLPQEIDPSNDALLHAAGESAALLAQGDSALTSLRDLLAAYPSTPYLHYAYGLALAAASQLEAALQQQRQELKISPQSELPQLEINRLLVRLHRPPQSQSPTLSNATPLREARLIELYSTHTATSTAPAPRSEFDSLVHSAQAAQSTGDVSGALRDYHQALQLRPDWDDGRWAAAMLSYTTQRYSDAIAELKTFVARKPANGTAWAVMGLSEFEMHDYDNALIHLQRGQQLGFGGSAESIDLASYRLGLLLNRSADFDRATAVLAPVATSKTLGPQIEFALGETLLRMPLLPQEVPAAKIQLVQAAGQISNLLQSSRYDQALPKLQALLQKYPATPFLHYACGVALESLSQYDDAEPHFREEAKLSPSSALPDIRLASMALRTHQPAKALTSALLAVQLAPGSAESHYVLGRSYLALDQNELAARELESARNLAPDSPEIHFNLAKAYGKLKQPEKAQSEQETFVRLNALAEQARATRGTQSYGDTNSRTGLAITPGSALQ